MKSVILRSATALAIGMGLAMSAHAVDTWTYTSTSGGAGVDTASNGAATLTTTGVYASNAVAGTGCTTTCTTMSSGITGNWSSGALTAYPGLGMSTDGNTEPNHALDNAGSYTEGVLLSFSTSTILTGIDLSYVSGDADISVFRYTGNTAPAALTSTGASLAAMQTAGWQLVGNYANLTPDSTTPYAYNLINGATDSDPTSGVTPTASSSSVGSSWWLITAYNTAYGSGSGLSQGDDYFKLLSVAGTSCGTGNTNACGPKKVSEPGSLALAGLAMIGVFYSRRRRV